MKFALFYIFAVVCMILLAGCGGSHTEQNTCFVEAGTTARVCSDCKQKVCVKDTAGKDHVEKRNIGGMIVMPKTNYDELRRGYLSASVKPDPTTVAPPPPVPPAPQKLSPVELLPPK